MPETARRSPRDTQYHHGDLRSALIHAAVQVLSGPEPHTLSFRDLARKLGVTTAAPYHHFKDRSDLLIHIAREGFALLLERLQLAASHALTSDDKTAAMTVGYLEFARKEAGYYRAMFLPEVRAAMEADPESRSMADRPFRFVCAVIAEAHDTLSEQQVSERAISVWALMHGLVILSSTGILGRRLSAHHEDRVATEAALRLLSDDPTPPPPTT